MKSRWLSAIDPMLLLNVLLILVLNSARLEARSYWNRNGRQLQDTSQSSLIGISSNGTLCSRHSSCIRHSCFLLNSTLNVLYKTGYNKDVHRPEKISNVDDMQPNGTHPIR